MAADVKMKQVTLFAADGSGHKDRIFSVPETTLVLLVANFGSWSLWKISQDGEMEQPEEIDPSEYCMLQVYNPHDKYRETSQKIVPLGDTSDD